MPRSCVVIGAGVLGVCVAACLAEAGAEVTLLEQAQPGHGATRWSFAWLNANQKTPRAYYELNHAGMRAWRSSPPAPVTCPARARSGTGRSAISNGRTVPPGTRSSRRESAASPNGGIRPP